MSSYYERVVLPAIRSHHASYAPVVTPRPAPADAPTPAQARVLAVVDRHGASMLGFRTWPSANVVHAGSARALVRAGVLVEFMGPDGVFVRRAPG